MPLLIILSVKSKLFYSSEDFFPGPPMISLATTCKFSLIANHWNYKFVLQGYKHIYENTHEMFHCISNIDYTNIPTGLVIFVKLLLQNTVKSSHLLINFLKPAFLQIRGKHDDYHLTTFLYFQQTNDLIILMAILDWIWFINHPFHCVFTVQAIKTQQGLHKPELHLFHLAPGIWLALIW